jgi:hypothetical protein
MSARICAPDAAILAAMGETARLDADPLRTYAKVSATTGDHARRQRRPSYGS